MTHEIARRLAAHNEVTWLTSRPGSLPPEEERDGVRIVRRGSELTTRLAAPGFVRSEKWDVIVEEINTLPYFAHLWARSPTVLFIPQLAREVWWYEAPRTIAPIGYVIEPLYLAAYRRQDVITISRSTRDDLWSLGLRGPIHVVPMGASNPPLSDLPPKRPTGRLVAIGRLVGSKRFDHAIYALERVRAVLPNAVLTVIGDGPARTTLLQTADRLGLGTAVHLPGLVSETEKKKILEGADLLLACSVREGWGLTPTEAARLGTPAVAYDVPGLRDSIVNERTGLLTEPRPASLAEAIIRVLTDEALYGSLREQAWISSRELSWDRTASAFERALVSGMSRQSAARRRTVF